MLECSVIDFSSIKRFKISLLLYDLTKYVLCTTVLCFYSVFNIVCMPVAITGPLLLL